MNIRTAIASVADSRADFFEKRKELFSDEISKLDWIRKEYSSMESGTIQSGEDITIFGNAMRAFDPQSLIIHIPIWADPILAVKLYKQMNIPVLLLGNNRPDTSSLVGMLGAGGALDQLGYGHIRVFNSDAELDRKQVVAFIKASGAISQLRGQSLGRFGGRSLGIMTADIDPTQWNKEFGVYVEHFDQQEIIDEAEGIDSDEVRRYKDWMCQKVGRVEFAHEHSERSFEKQVRSYLATRNLVKKHNLNFVAVKCQSELSDGYVSQCLAHALMNSSIDISGEKKPFVHACESDGDGALTMQIMNLLSNGKAASLLDIRWYNKESGIWTLANCGAVSLDFFATNEDKTGLSKIQIVPHVFGKGGGSALTGVVQPQQVTIARLCRRNGKYWMAIISGRTESPTSEDMNRTTKAFPKAFVKSTAGEDFMECFGSNHVHMVSGDISLELIMFCQLSKMEYKVWKHC